MRRSGGSGGGSSRFRGLRPPRAMPANASRRTRARLQAAQAEPTSEHRVRDRSASASGRARRSRWRWHESRPPEHPRERQRAGPQSLPSPPLAAAGCEPWRAPTAALVPIGSASASGSDASTAVEEIAVRRNPRHDGDRRGDVDVDGLGADDQSFPPRDPAHRRRRHAERHPERSRASARAVADAASTGPTPHTSPACPQSSGSVAATTRIRVMILSSGTISFVDPMVTGRFVDRGGVADFVPNQAEGVSSKTGWRRASASQLLVGGRERDVEERPRHATLAVVLAQNRHRFCGRELLDSQSLASSTTLQQHPPCCAGVPHPVPVAVGRNEPALAFLLDDRDRRRPELSRSSSRHGEEMGSWPCKSEPGERTNECVERTTPGAPSVRLPRGDHGRSKPSGIRRPPLGAVVVPSGRGEVTRISVRAADSASPSAPG